MPRVPLLLALALPTPALADRLTLDTGAVVEGELDVYRHLGDCEIRLTGGELAGALLVVPCTRVARFEKAVPEIALILTPAEPEPTGEPVSELPVEPVEPLPELALPAEVVVTEAPSAGDDIGEAPPAKATATDAPIPPRSRFPAALQRPPAR